jgi:predicted ATP-binding protein involved in virulence
MITSIELKNFKIFSDRVFEFNSEFNLIAGLNGSGKSSLLRGVAVALAGWAHAYIKSDGNLRPIIEDEIREIEIDGRFDKAKDTAIIASGVFPIINRFGNSTKGKVVWKRYRVEGKDYTFLEGDIKYKNSGFNSDEYSTKSYNLNLSTLGADVLKFIENGHDFDLPLIAFYECDRLWISKGEIDVTDAAKKQYSRFDPYKDCFHTGVDDKSLVEWLLKLELSSIQKNEKNYQKVAIEFAAMSALEGCIGFGFDFEESRVLVKFNNGSSMPFEHLSDGQRTIVSLFCDIARRATILNPHLKSNVCSQVQGVVLVDELDLHLHPRWQRRVIHSLRKTFPKIQFICTTHSPFLIQSLRDGSELIKMDGQPLLDYQNKGIEEISRDMGVEKPQASVEYMQMKEDAKSFLSDLENAEKKGEEKAEFEKRLEIICTDYADNPAYQAFLELRYLSKFGG